MEVDCSGLEVLTEEEARRLLASTSLGRLALNVGALPVVVPVAYQMSAAGIILRAGEGTTVEGATRGTVVGFEADDIDPRTGEGWTVTVTGVATHLGPGEVPEEAALLPRANGWSGRAETRVVCISVEILAGRRCHGRANANGNGRLKG